MSTVFIHEKLDFTELSFVDENCAKEIFSNFLLLKKKIVFLILEMEGSRKWLSFFNLTNFFRGVSQSNKEQVQYAISRFFPVKDKL